MAHYNKFTDNDYKRQLLHIFNSVDVLHRADVRKESEMERGCSRRVSELDSAPGHMNATWQPQMCPPRAIMAPRLPDFNVNRPPWQALSAELQRFAQGPRPPLILSPRPHFVSLTLLTEMWRNSAVETLHICSPSPSSSVWCGDICSFKSAVKTSWSASCVVHF